MDWWCIMVYLIWFLSRFFSKEIHEQKHGGGVGAVGHLQHPMPATSPRPVGPVASWTASTKRIPLRSRGPRCEIGGTLKIPREDWGTSGKTRGITTPPLKIPTRFYFFESKLYVVLSKSFFIPLKVGKYDPTVFKRRSVYLKWVEVAQLAKEVPLGVRLMGSKSTAELSLTARDTQGSM